MGAQLFKEKSLLDEAHTRYLHPASSSSELSLLKLRDDTPGTEHVVHFNNAGASLPPTPVLLAVEQYLKAEATIGGYEAVDRYVAALERPYSLIASLINCQPSEVAVVTSATVAWQQVVYGLAWLWKPGDRLLTSVAEYGSNYIAYLQLKKRTGVQIEVIPETAGGDLDLPAAERMILDGAKPVLISVTYIPTSSGKVYDAEGLGKLAKRHGILYMLDACQAVGQVPVDVQRLGCDFLSATGRKFLRAPRGSGFLYASRDVMDRFEPAVLDNVGARWVAKDTYQLEPTAKRFECYEMSFAAKVGLGVAVDYCLQLGVADTIWPRVQKLAHILRAGLMALPGVRVWDQGRILCGIVSFTKAGMPADSIQQRLAANKINVAVSRAGSSRLDFESRGIQEVVRVSVHYYNTEREVQQLLDAVEQL